MNRSEDETWTDKLTYTKGNIEAMYWKGGEIIGHREGSWETQEEVTNNDTRWKCQNKTGNETKKGNLTKAETNKPKAFKSS